MTGDLVPGKTDHPRSEGIQLPPPDHQPDSRYCIAEATPRRRCGRLMIGVRREICLALVGHRYEARVRGGCMLLRRLATRRRATSQPPVRYDAERMVAQVIERGIWVDSWQSSVVLETKKADMETGEDQKGS